MDVWGAKSAANSLVILAISHWLVGVKISAWARRPCCLAFWDTLRLPSADLGSGGCGGVASIGGQARGGTHLRGPAFGAVCLEFLEADLRPEEDEVVCCRCAGDFGLGVAAAAVGFEV